MDTIDYGRIIVLMKDGSQGSAFDIEKEVLFGRCELLFCFDDQG
jgi:hypothetical protein